MTWGMVRIADADGGERFLSLCLYMLVHVHVPTSGMTHLAHCSAGVLPRPEEEILHVDATLLLYAAWAPLKNRHTLCPRNGSKSE